jgi:hypothetical protein
MAALAVGVALAGNFPRAVLARTEPAYCAVSRGQGTVYQDCRYATLAECLEELKGLGGHCQPNPRYVAPPSRERAGWPEPRRRTGP